MNILNEIKQLLSDMGGEVELKTRLVVKTSPHTKPIILYKISIENLEYKEPVLQTILQRLKLIKAGYD